MARDTDFRRICELGGIEALDPQTGWPGRARYRKVSDGAFQQLSFYAAPVARHRERSPHERKIEPPGRFRPIHEADASLPLVIAWTNVVADNTSWPLLVAFLAPRRVSDNARWNQTFFMSFLRDAVSTGWAEYSRSMRGGGYERIYAFDPVLLRTFLEILSLGIDPPGSGDLQAVETNGTTESERRSITLQEVARYFRDRSFAPRVKAAYQNKCAMCGLGLELIEAAHVMPVGSGVAADVVANGFAACTLHHKAFDGHYIYVSPGSREITFSNAFREKANSPIDQAFINSTFEYLAEPVNATLRVKDEWLMLRHEFFIDEYAWWESMSAGP